MGVKQQIPSSTNAPKTLQFAKLRGLDCSTSPFEVIPTRAVDMKNIINDDGINHKRQGWTENTEHSKVLDSLNISEVLGVYDIKLQNVTNKIFVPIYVYAGISGNNVRISVKLKNQDYKIYVPSMFEYACMLENKTMNCFENEGSAYLLGCGEYNKIYIKETEISGYDYEIAIENSSSFAYIPTTVKSKNNNFDIKNKGATSSNFESANVLTPKRKNSFIISEMPRMYGIALSVHELFTKEYQKVIFRFTNNTTNAITELEAKGKEYVVFKLEGGSYTFRIICDDKESSLFQMDDFKPEIVDENETQKNIYDVQYVYLRTLQENSEVTINSNKYPSPAMFIYSDIMSKHYQIVKWTKGNVNVDLGEQFVLYEQAQIVTGIGYSPNYSYFDNTVYEFDTKAKHLTWLNVSIKSKYDLSSKNYGGEIIEYTAKIGIYKDSYTKLIVTHNAVEYHIGFVNNERIILINSDLKTYDAGVDNMEVQFEDAESEYTSLIKYCEYGLSYSLTGYNDKLFVFGNKQYPATLYFTGYNDLSYFPYINYNVVGSSVNKISGLSILSDSTIAVHKENDFKEASIYYMTAQNVTIEDKKELAFVISVGTLGETPVNSNVCNNFCGESVIFSSNGVYAIQTGSNIKVSERYALERSSFVNAKLVKTKDKDNATAVVYENRYYLAVGDVVYVADARYKSSPRDQDMNDTFNYEWWYWDNMPVKKWVILDNKLWFITKNNKLATFTNSRIDETLHLMSVGDWTGEELTNKIQFNGNNKHLLKDGNKVIIGDTTLYIVTDKDTPYNSQFQLKDENDDIVDVSNEVFGNFMKLFYICDLNNVISEWYTPLLNMGTSLYSKNLIGSTLTFEPDVEGNVKFGYLTRRSGGPKDKESNLSPSNGLDFEDVSFNDFSFAVNFACSRTLKTRVRNYNYIQFRVISEDNKDCALNNFVVTYTIGRKNKGVR